MTLFTSLTSTKRRKLTLLILILVLAVLPCVYAGEALANIQIMSLHESYDFYFEFDDQLFDNDARIYNHDMAATSMCMAMSAFRPYQSESEGLSGPDEKLLVFLESAGFYDFVSDDYDKNPSLYTVATAIGRKDMTDSEGNPYTVIAIGVCGGGYKDEWLSNLTVGNENRHKGFNSAAHMVVNRIFGYIGTRNITGRIKIWISGYSRAAAVSNIAAADLTSSGFFREEDIFAYTFATPNTVRQPEREYSNIYNIVGQYDVVPMVPLAEWGYRRYGTVFTTPLQETDSNYISRLRSGPNDIHVMFTGSDYWNNVEMNNELRSMLSFIGEICPSAEIYEQCMQDRLISMMKNKNPVNILRNLFGMADDPRLITEENADEANQFINRFALLVYMIITGNRYDDQWNSEAKVFVNLVHEHSQEVYFSWIIGAEEENSYTKNHTYATVGVFPLGSGKDYSYSVVDNDDGSRIAFVKGDSVTYLSEDFHPHITVSPDRALFRLPMDGNYSVVFEAEGENACLVSYMPTDTLKLYDQDVYINMYELKNESLTVFTTNMPLSADWEALSDESDPLNANGIRSVQGYKNLPVNWRVIVISLIVVPVVLIMILTWVALFVASKIRKTGFRSLDYLLGCVVLILVVFDGIYMMIVRSLAIQILVKVLIALAFSGISYKRKREFNSVSALIIALCVADILRVFNVYLGMAFMAVSYVFMIFICLYKEKIPVNRIIYWAAAAVLSGLLLHFRLNVSWPSTLIACVSILVPFAAWDREQSVRNASVLIAAQDVLYVIFLHSYDTHMTLFYMHMAAFYLALLFLAMGSKKKVSA